MIRGATPDMHLRLKKPVDLESANSVYVTIEQSLVKITKTGEDLTFDGTPVKNEIYVWLTQEESLRLHQGCADVQVNWTYFDIAGNKRRGTTHKTAIEVGKQLLPEVID